MAIFWSKLESNEDSLTEMVSIFYPPDTNFFEFLHYIYPQPHTTQSIHSWWQTPLICTFVFCFCYTQYNDCAFLRKKNGNFSRLSIGRVRVEATGARYCSRKRPVVSGNWRNATKREELKKQNLEIFIRRKSIESGRLPAAAAQVSDSLVFWLLLTLSRGAFWKLRNIQILAFQICIALTITNRLVAIWKSSRSTRLPVRPCFT
jgi:hypothetical protein